MSRIAPLTPPYAPDIQEQFDRIMRGAPPLMRDQPVQHTAAGTSENTLKSWHGAQPSSPGISV